MTNDEIEGVIRAMVAISGVDPRKLINHPQLTPTERAMAQAERFGQFREVERFDAPRFKEEPTKDWLWPESFATDTGEPENQKPAFTESYWDPAKRHRQSWKD